MLESLHGSRACGSTPRTHWERPGGPGGPASEAPQETWSNGSRHVRSCAPHLDSRPPEGGDL